MKLTPWRKREGATTGYGGELQDLWSRFLQAVDEGFEGRMPEMFRRRGVPPADLTETEQAFELRFELPGLKEEDIDLSLRGRQLVVSGERRWESEPEAQAAEVHRVESYYGSFQRSITLPEGARLDPEAITARYRRGILEVVVPKVEPTPARRIEVRKDGPSD